MEIKKTSDDYQGFHAREALERWQRGDLMMALYYLDKAGFHGIEAMFSQIASTVNA